MIPSMQGSVFAPDLQLMTIAAYACFPQPLGPGFEDMTEPPLGRQSGPGMAVMTQPSPRETIAARIKQMINSQSRELRDGPISALPADAV
jgi:hypothetical protein